MVLEIQLSSQAAKCGMHQCRSHKTDAWLQEWTTRMCHGLASSAHASGSRDPRLLQRALDQASRNLISNQPSILPPHLVVLSHLNYSHSVPMVPQLPPVPLVITSQSHQYSFSGTHLVTFLPFTESLVAPSALEIKSNLLSLTYTAFHETHSAFIVPYAPLLTLFTPDFLEFLKHLFETRNCCHLTMSDLQSW